MLPIKNLDFGFSDAENYKRRENKERFNKIFIKNEFLETLVSPSISFLIGEKGTGKTAYAVYLSNNNYKNSLGSIRYIRETEYQKFITLKKEKKLGLSDYASIWKVIIYLLISNRIYEKEGTVEFFKRFGKFKALKDAIDEYYYKAFSPEIIQALQFVQESKIAAELLAKYAKASGEEKETFTFSESRFQTNLFYIQKKFESALSQIRLEHNHILFIDGIDIRPSSIPYDDYLECIKGLANAVWEINNDFFPTIKGGKGRLRTVLLIRPDIFISLGLQNQNTKIRDNSVFLDWRTNYPNHRNSKIFEVSNHLLAEQSNQELKPDNVDLLWDYYFNWNAPNVKDEYSIPTSFIAFLRWSYYRPRDIVTMLSIMQEVVLEKNVSKQVFEYKDFDNVEFKRRYSSYLLGELKDHLTFYYSEEDYEIFLKFFEFLEGKNTFSYDVYTDTFNKFMEYGNSISIDIPRFMLTANDFLQFLYDLNIISYIETPEFDMPYIRWCFRERSYSNIMPKVKENVDYQIFYGLYKALNVGQEFTKL
ncbi:P-loop ATPase, Sll1717 family [Candidatus Marinarcus aquaticus]|uniref:FunZ protein n=1 Tax=Candidatus Marinarcus aquaticus TaxID=2044504 RepID=A0A4Q0XTW3_9BACT|nr:funZ protein [Candidatus Marinarcus aquaticus]RXJ60886.1 funZ protein [Candidatus Marinarcus aquaticus]